MTISEQAKAFKTAIDAWIESRVKGVVCNIVFDLLHLWEQAQMTSDKPNVWICYNGETPKVNEAEVCSHVDRKWVIALKRGRGFNAVRGESLTDAKQNALAMYDLLEELRDLCRGDGLYLDGGFVTLPPDFTGIQPLRFGDQISDAYLIEVSLISQIPQLVAA